MRKLRISGLLLILLSVAVSSWQMRQRTTSWTNPLWVAIYPVVGDDTAATRRYIRSLQAGDYADIDEFLTAQSALYGLNLPAPLHIRLRSPVDMPPLPPANGMLATMLWSLRLRFWAWRVQTRDDGPPPHVQMFVVFHDPELRQRVPHSLGLQKGLIGIVHAYASKAQAAENRVVIAHELLHTLGATDKYHLATGEPLFPQGYAKPDQQPRYPQQRAEIMAGRIPEGPQRSRMPSSLREVIIGPDTAREINWLRPNQDL